VLWCSFEKLFQAVDDGNRAALRNPGPFGLERQGQLAAKELLSWFRLARATFYEGL